MAGPSSLGTRLKADRGAGLADLGGTRDMHFFGLATRPAGYRTIIVGVDGKGNPSVNDSVPVEP